MGELRDTERFDVTREIGRGGMGVVYEAVDRSTGAAVALKSLRFVAPELILHLKNEFRALQDLYHPNLVSLGDLVEDRGEWFFSMELVDGELLVDHVAAAPPGQREARLREVIGQLAKGLNALHEFGKVHRDVKPSNVMVDRGGRVVILDFGLVTDLHADSGGDPIGSVAYMAPEQAAGGRVSPASDWYAFGVVLYELLSGELPFAGSPRQIIEAKQSRAAPPLEGVADDLAALSAELLAFDPGDRPSGGEVLLRLGVEDSHLLRVPESVSSRGRGPFIGRHRELAALRAAFDETAARRAVSVLVHGPSGVGKSSLVERFLTSLPDTATVLRGRCYEREWVPFKALDTVGDAIAQMLRGLPPEAVESICGDGAVYAADLFPVLRRVPAIRDRGRVERLPDLQEQRSRAFASFRQLLARLAAETRLVLVIDDLQWADEDSLSLLSEALAEPDAPPLLFLATERETTTTMTTLDPVGDEPVSIDEPIQTRSLARRMSGDVRTIGLSNLGPEAARELAERLIAAAEIEHLDPEAVAREAGGHPLFIDTLIRARADDDSDEPIALDSAMWSRVARLGSDERSILAVLAVAAGPVPQKIAAEASRLAVPTFSRLCGLLRVAHLVRTGGSRMDDAIDVYHDRIRRTIESRLSAGALAEWHQRLADALELHGADPEALMIHYAGAGDFATASRHAEAAAAQADAALAFERSARLYRRALELAAVEPGVTPQRPGAARAADLRLHELRVAMGDAYAHAGRGAGAAVAYLEALPTANAVQALELRRRAGEQLLRCGRVDAGLEQLEQVLASVGSSIPKTRNRAIARLLWRRLRMTLRGYKFKERDEAEVKPGSLTRIDVLWTATTQVSFIDPTSGSYFSALHLQAALDAGEPYRVCRALAVECAYLVARGERARAKMTAIWERALELAERIDNAHAIALVLGMRGLAGFAGGRWRDGYEHAERGIRLMTAKCAGVPWELNNGRFFAASCLTYMGDFTELGRRLPALIRAAEDRGDWYASANLRTGILNASWLAAGDPMTARTEAVESFSRWSQEGYHMQHVSDLNANSLIDLYEGDAGAAHRRVTESWPRLRRSFLMTVEFIRVICLDLRGKVSLAAALAGDSAALATARRDAHKLLGEKVAWAQALGALLAAGVAAAEGDRDGAAEEYLAAAAQLDALDMTAHAAIARMRRAALVDRSKIDPELALLRDCGIVDPARFARIYAPVHEA